ncbi:MAG: hypothetical protein L3K08_02275 [Thermoplasmata archaeon]|nr:hypothetical protein [Thermoplasmata archaeon]
MLLILFLVMPGISIPTIAHAPAPSINCTNGGEYSTTNLTVSPSDCQATISLQYGQWVTQGGYYLNGAFNLSCDLPIVAEITPAGNVVADANLLEPSKGWSGVMTLGVETNFTTAYQANVTDARGGWNLTNTPWGSAMGWWADGNTTLGTTEVGIVWHFLTAGTGSTGSNSSRNGTGVNASVRALPTNGSGTGATPPGMYRVEFDLNVNGWPWVNGSDHLGVELDSLGVWGSHFVYDPIGSPPGTLIDLSNNASASTGYVGLQLGSAAATNTATGTLGDVNVTSTLGLFTAGTADREAVFLLNFTGGGGYQNLSYDPWVIFQLGAGGSGGGRGPPTLTNPFLPNGAIVSIVLASALVFVAATVLFRARRRPADSGLVPRPG